MFHCFRHQIRAPCRPGHWAAAGLGGVAIHLDVRARFCWLLALCFGRKKRGVDGNGGRAPGGVFLLEGLSLMLWVGLSSRASPRQVSCGEGKST